MFVKEIDFQVVFEVWSQNLWPNRKSKIQRTSSMVFGGGYDISIHKLYPPFFWGAFDKGFLVGVNSGHKTSETEFRSRGLYVFPEYRNNGFGSALLSKACESASASGCSMIWSAPRSQATRIYEKVGFSISPSELGEEHGFEFGPNLYAQKSLPVEVDRYLE